MYTENMGFSSEKIKNNNNFIFFTNKNGRAENKSLLLLDFLVLLWHQRKLCFHLNINLVFRTWHACYFIHFLTILTDEKMSKKPEVDGDIGRIHSVSKVFLLHKYSQMFNYESELWSKKMGKKNIHEIKITNKH